jgi:membrane protein
MDAADQRWWRRFLLNQGQILTLVMRGFFVDGCMLRASALTFTTLLSLVPLLALMFSVLKGFGVQNELEPLLLDQLAVGSGEAVTKKNHLTTSGGLKKPGPCYGVSQITFRS